MIVIGLIFVVTGGLLMYHYLQGHTQQTMFIPLIACVLEFGGMGLVMWGFSILNNTS